MLHYRLCINKTRFRGLILAKQRRPEFGLGPLQGIYKRLLVAQASDPFLLNGAERDRHPDRDHLALPLTMYP